MLKGFRDFISRGNVIDLAVGVIVGAAFGTIVSSLVADVITPIIGMIFGKPDFSAIQLGPIMFGKFINAIVSFLFTAFGLYFFIVLPFNKMKKEEAPAAPPALTLTEQYLKEIRDLMRK